MKKSMIDEKVGAPTGWTFSSLCRMFDQLRLLLPCRRHIFQSGFVLQSRHLKLKTDQSSNYTVPASIPRQKLV